MLKLLQSYWDALLLLWPKLVMALVVFGLFVLIGKLIRGFVAKRIRTKWGSSIVSGFILQLSSWIAYIIGIFAALNVLGFNNLFGGLIAGAGLSAVVIGFAFKDIAENFLAGILLAFNRPFEIGNIIEVDGFRGTVKKLNLRNTHLRNVEGKDIFIPNSILVVNTITNYTLDGFLRMDFAVGIAPESDVQQCRKLILDYLNNSTLILQDPKPNVIIKELGVSTVDLSVLFWVDILKVRSNPEQSLGSSVRSTIIGDVKELLDRNGIEMPANVQELKMYRKEALRLSQKD